jgi:DEAD/DEAH box helicase domain-containing protein
MKGVTHWEVLPAKEGVYLDFPSGIDPRLVEVLRAQGIDRLYSHQGRAIDLVSQGKNVVVVTPTASGKSLCYNLPVLDSILKDPDHRALYLFPTKALSQDQVTELLDLIEALGVDIKTYTFDGDTPASARKAIRTAGQIVVTNPDMLHTGILPHHTRWVKLFETLRYVVIDEVHHYRGVFGSHLTNVIRRLKRLCRFYGTEPQFVCCSATIANPKELAEKIVEEEVELVDNNGAPSAQKHFVLYNPPVVNRQLGIRKSSVKEAQRIALDLISNNIQTIVFARSRLRVEILTTYLKESLRGRGRGSGIICGYRGGYLPNERRKIERGLRETEIMGVVSTNALELGIDIGNLSASIMAGYPGNIASTWQQAGRAGRKQGLSLAILIATSSPLDQFIVNHPEYFFGTPPETGIIDPNNLYILTSHLKCAAFELPFEEKESFGAGETIEFLKYLEERRILRHSGDKFYWTSEIYPAEEVSLRTASPQNFAILNRDRDNAVIGEVDYYSAPELVHPDAIYMHQSQQFQITDLDWEGKKAYAKEAGVDYYTDAQTKADIKVLDIAKEAEPTGVEKEGGEKAGWGEVSVTKTTVQFKKIKLHTHENVGWGKLNLPEIEMHTTSFWYQFREGIAETLKMKPGDLGGALKGVANILTNIVPLWVMCDPADIRALSMIRSPFSDRPTVYLYDNYPGGVGFSEKIFNQHEEIFASALELVTSCGCESGCPSCVGPPLEVGECGKSGALSLLRWSLGQL